MTREKEKGSLELIGKKGDSSALPWPTEPGQIFLLELR
jgi:hypothetical protein